MSKRDEQLLECIEERQAGVARLLNLPPQAVSQGIKRAKDYFQGATLEQLRVALMENNKADKADRLVAFCAEEVQRKPALSLMDQDTKRRINNNLYENFVIDERGSLGIWALTGEEAIGRIQAETPVIAEVLKRPLMEGRALVILGSKTHLALLKSKLNDLMVSQWLSTALESDDWEQLEINKSMPTGKVIFIEKEWPSFTLEFLLLRRKVTAAGMVFTKKGFVSFDSSIAERYITLLDASHKLAAVQTEDSQGIAASWHSDMIPYLRCLSLWESILENHGVKTACRDVLQGIHSCLEDFNFYANRRLNWAKAGELLGLQVSIDASSTSTHWGEIMKLNEEVKRIYEQPDTTALWQDILEEMKYYILKL